MRLIDRLRHTFGSLARRKRAEQLLDDEFQFHVDRLIEQNLTAGMDPASARTEALRELGGLSQYREQCRDTRGLNALEDLAKDIRYGWRMLLRSPGFTAVAVLSLALGIGANTAIFTLIHSLVLRPLPVSNPQELVQIVLQRPRGAQPSVSYYAFEFFRQHSELFAGVFVQANTHLNVSFGGQPTPIESAFVSGDYFSTLGVAPMLGRSITAADDQESGGPDGPIAVISYPFWIGRFAGDRAILGQAVMVQGVALRIAGVMPPSFFGTEVGKSPNLYVPLQLEPVLQKQQSMLKERGAWWLNILARRRPGISDTQMRSALAVLWPQVLSDVIPRFRGQIVPGMRTWRLDITDASHGTSGLRRQFSEPLYILMGIVGLVLLIACANVANLLLARTSARQREVAVRLALGASRARLMRQLLTESVMLSLFGAAVGVVFAFWGCRFLVALLSGDAQAVALDVWPDPWILGFTATVALSTGLLFGVGPALRATRGNTSSALKENSLSVARRSKIANVLVVCQVALCLILLIGAGLFVRTFWNLTHQDLGYQHRNLYVAAIDPRSVGYKNGALTRLYAELQANLKSNPAVESASLSVTTPIANCCWFENLLAEGFTEKAGEQKTVYMNSVTPGFFKTFGARLLLGRDFSDHDGGPLVGIISESVAKRYFEGASPIGKHISITDDRTYQNVEIIGVVEDMRTRGLRAGIEYEAYFNMLQSPSPGGMIVEIRSARGLATVATLLREQVHGFNKQIAVNVDSFSEQIGRTALRDRMTAILAGFFGALALLLACVGLYGIMSYTVICRTSELGIRMALGARTSDVRWMIIREALFLAAAGTVIGIPVALLCTKLVTSLSTLLFGLKPGDPTTIAATTLLLVALAAIAGYFPARRATRLDPMRALRNE